MAINSLSAASNGLSGLVSGIGSQDMVEKLLSGTQSKIDKAGQKKTLLQYKQQMYRDVTAKLKSLQSGFLSFTSKTNLLSSSFYNTMNAVITPPKGSSAAFSVTATGSAQIGNYSMDYIQQLAQAYSKKTTSDATGGVGGTLNKNVAANLLEGYRGEDATLTIKVGEQSVTFENAPELFSGMTGSQVADTLNTKLIAAGAEARYVNNKLTITASNADSYITIQGNTESGAKNKTLAMKMFGEYATLGGKGSFSSAVNTDNYDPEFVVNLDGRQQTIKLKLADLDAFVSTGDGKNLADNLADSLRRAFGAGVGVEQIADGAGGPVTGLSFTSGSKSQRFTITGSNNVLEVLGFKSGASNKLNASLAIKDLNFATALQGNMHTFTINGVGFSFTADSSLSSIIGEINGSKAGVKISYIESEDRFMIENAETGAGNDRIDFSQSEGNFLSALFGVAGSSQATTLPVAKTLAGASFTDEASIAKGGVFTFNVNGTDYKFTVKAKANDGSYTIDEFAAELNKAFRSTFGTMADGSQSIAFSYNEDESRFEINANNSSFVVVAKAYNKDTNTNALGFAAADSTRVTSAATTLEQAGINFGTGGLQIDLGSYGTITLDGGDLDGKSMAQVAQLLQDEVRAALGQDGTGAGDVSISYDEKAAGFKFMGISIPMEIMIVKGSDSENLTNLFGTDTLSINAPALKAGTPSDPLFIEREGKNAKFSFNGSVIERASNSFTIDGLTFSLHNTTYKDPLNVPTNPTASDFEQASQINISRNTDQIVDGLKEFLKMYNETIDYLNGLYKADATYKDYAPLTQKQKESMSEREIQLWEEKSKEGLLRNDSSIGKILQNLRSALYTKPEGSAIAIYDIGISTSFYANDGNFVETSDGALKAAVENDPAAIRQLLSGDGGLMELLNNAITDATRSSYANPGTLVSLAGSNSLDTTSSIYKQIKEVDSQLTTLESRYWNEYDRYWKQFNSMEQMIQQMNTQSSWLSQQFS